MLKETISYEDFNGNNRTETLRFNMTKSELMDIMDIQPRLAAWQESVDGQSGDLSMEQIGELLYILKLLVEKAYGVVSDDGRNFRKSPELFYEFSTSAAYDAFLMNMFQNPDKAVNFMYGIMPKDLAQQTLNEISKPADIQDVELPQESLTAVETEVPAYIREGRTPTPAEFSQMSDVEKLQAFQYKSQNS